MKTTHLIAALVGLVAVCILAADSAAMYNPSTGTFMQRDPGAGGATRTGAGGSAPAGGFVPMDQYADGMNLYQYVRSNPIIYVDWTGAQASQPGTQPAPKPVDICKLLGGKHCDPQPIPPNTPVDIPINLGTLGLFRNFCGEITITQVANVQDNLKYTNIALAGGKPCDKIKINVAHTLNNLLNQQIKLDCMKTEGKDDKGQDKWVVDPDQECCYKASFNGQHPVTAKISITVPVAADPDGKNGGLCAITGNAQATLTAQGKVGQCVKKKK